MYAVAVLIIYRYENVDGMCTLKTCVARGVDYTSPLVCGSPDCVFNGSACSPECGPFATPDSKGFAVVM
jgi:hypothetical protein